MSDLKWRETNVLMFGKIAIANWKYINNHKIAFIITNLQ